MPWYFDDSASQKKINLFLIAQIKIVLICWFTVSEPGDTGAFLKFQLLITFYFPYFTSLIFKAT